MLKPIVVHAPAKVNLYLGINPEIVDGRHTLDTIYHPLCFGDTVTIEQAKEFEFVMEPDYGVSNDNNLAYVAAIAMQRYFERQMRVRITVEKRIPEQAGLGGGSSDAAAVIAGLCKYWGFNKLDPLVQYIASILGSDTVGFLYDGPTHMTSFGEKHVETFEPLDLPLVLVKPNKGVSTAEAYRVFDSLPSPSPRMPLDLLVAGLRQNDAELAVSHFANNLEDASITLVPEIADIIAWLHGQSGTHMPRMAGSGSCCFAVCDSDKEAQQIAEAARGRGWWAEATCFSDKGAHVIDDTES